MTPFFRKILCPVDIDSNGISALDCAALVARQNNAEVVVLHVIAIALSAENAPFYTDLYKPKADEIRQKLTDLARKHLRDVSHQVRVEIGHPPTVIVDTAARLPADLLVMASHRRRFSRLLLGSVAETVMREVECPVLTVKNLRSDRFSVAHWMTAQPVTISPNDPITLAHKLMQEGNFRSLPVVGGGRLIGMITDRDVRSAMGKSETLTVDEVMSRDLITVTSNTSIFDASRLLVERRIGAVPVIEDGQFIGIISTDDLIKAFAEVH